MHHICLSVIPSQTEESKIEKYQKTYLKAIIDIYLASYPTLGSGIFRICDTL